MKLSLKRVAKCLENINLCDWWIKKPHSLGIIIIIFKKIVCLKYFIRVANSEKFIYNAIDKIQKDYSIGSKVIALKKAYFWRYFWVGLPTVYKFT